MVKRIEGEAPSSRTCRGFTLIELLVVIAIIAILAAILFPVFARAREKARTATCQSNEKQMLLSMLMYVQDYDEKFPMFAGYAGSGGALPYTCNWANTVQPYIKNSQVWICPSVVMTVRAPASYGSNAELLGNWERCPASCTGYPKSLSDIKSPASVILLMDELPRSSNTCGAASAADLDYMIANQSATYGNMWYRHSGGANWGMVDGHVKWLTMGSVGGTAGPAQGKTVWENLTN